MYVWMDGGREDGWMDEKTDMASVSYIFILKCKQRWGDANLMTGDNSFKIHIPHH
jgi:hypothetical protein